jgi:curli biogenesis system outer membrane secretion channel CsgG
MRSRAALAALAAAALSCAPGREAVVTPAEPTLPDVLEPYQGPKARASVSRFTDRTGQGWWSGEIGDGLAEQLSAALRRTDRYLVSDYQAPDTPADERALAAAGGPEARIQGAEGSELLVLGEVTEFEGPGAERAHVMIDLRVLDTSTSRILLATSVEGNALDAELDPGSGGGELGAPLRSFRDTPTGKALRLCIQAAADFMVSQTPPEYYRH